MKKTLLFLLIIAGCDLLRSGDAPSGDIIFASHDREAGNGIFTIREDGTDLNRLSNLEFGGTYPAWSPDGEQILFQSGNQSSSLGPTLWIMNADGSDARLVKDNGESTPPPLSGNHPRWSPDGTKIAFDFPLGRVKYEIWVFDRMTEQTVQLTQHEEGDNQFPQWSPDGNRIMFWSDRPYVNSDAPSGKGDLFIINADGSQVERITTAGVGPFLWYPDGNRVAYRPHTTSSPLYLLDMSTGESKVILRRVGSGDLRFTPRAWSPDGERLLITAAPLEDYTQQSMYIIDIESGDWDPLPYGPADIQGADWR